jgi:predicted DNA-binding mobile mystery protein A
MPRQNRLSIQQLEEKLRPFRQARKLSRPTGGWIRAVRDALGMTNLQLSKRVGRKPQTTLALQSREAAGTIQLNSLHELAEALECDLVYALVPRKPLDEILEERARLIARDTLRRTTHSMELERQGLGEREREHALEREVERLLTGSRRKLWG